MSTFGEEGKPPSSAMNTAALDTSWLDELPAAQGRRGSRRRTIRRRKTISPSKVTSFMDGVDFANDDPMSWPDIPYDDDIGKGVVDTSDKATSRKLSPGAGPAADGVSLYDERSDGPSNKAGTSWAASTDVAALLLVEREEETLEQQRKPSKPLGVLSALENHDGMSSLSRDDSSTNKSAQAVSVGKEALPAGARVSSGAENVQPPTEVTRTATGAAAAKPSPAEINREEVVVEPAAGASSSSSGTLGQPRVRKTSRTSRRRSIVMPSEARPFMDSADCAVGDGNANSAHSGGGAGAIASGGNEGATPATKNSSSGSTTIEKAMVRVTPAPVGAVTATSCLSCPLATQRGWKSEEGDTTRTLVRAYYAAPRGSQRARRVAARLFCITGYCLLPVTPEDARVLCEAAGDSLDWGLEETDKPQLKSKTFRRKTREQKRGLVLRIKPLFDLMEKASAAERLAVETATGIVARKAVPDGYCYEDRESAEPVDPEVYKAKYMEHIGRVSALRRRRFALETCGSVPRSEDAGGAHVEAEGQRGCMSGPKTASSSPLQPSQQAEEAKKNPYMPAAGLSPNVAGQAEYGDVAAAAPVVADDNSHRRTDVGPNKTDEEQESAVVVRAGEVRTVCSGAVELTTAASYAKGRDLSTATTNAASRGAVVAEDHAVLAPVSGIGRAANATGTYSVGKRVPGRGSTNATVATTTSARSADPCKATDEGALTPVASVLERNVAATEPVKHEERGGKTGEYTSAVDMSVERAVENSTKISCVDDDSQHFTCVAQASPAAAATYAPSSQDYPYGDQGSTAADSLHPSPPTIAPMQHIPSPEADVCPGDAASVSRGKLSNRKLQSSGVTDVVARKNTQVRDVPASEPLREQERQESASPRILESPAITQEHEDSAAVMFSSPVSADGEISSASASERTDGANTKAYANINLVSDAGSDSPLIPLSLSPVCFPVGPGRLDVGEHSPLLVQGGDEGAPGSSPENEGESVQQTHQHQQQHNPQEMADEEDMSPVSRHRACDVTVPETRPYSTVTNGSGGADLVEEVAAIEACLWAKWDTALRQYHTDVALAVSRHAQRQATEASSSARGRVALTAATATTTATATPATTGGSKDGGEEVRSPCEVVESPSAADRGQEESDDPPGSELVSAASLASPLGRSRTNDPTLLLDPSPLLPLLDLRLTEDDDLFGSAGGDRDGGRGLAGSGKGTRRRSLSLAFASSQSHSLSGAKQKQLRQRRAEGILSGDPLHQVEGESTETAPGECNMSKPKAAVAEQGGGEAQERPGKGDRVCELCCKRDCDAVLRPCNHTICGVCAEKLRVRAEQSGGAFSCPWDRQAVFEIDACKN